MMRQWLWACHPNYRDSPNYLHRPLRILYHATLGYAVIAITTSTGRVFRIATLRLKLSTRNEHPID
jgi:hypothetical protein